MARRSYSPGDRVVYHKEKHGLHPGPRARDVSPAPRGDAYHYAVEKYWVVAAAEADGRLRLVTRRGKVHLVEPTDPRLRPPTLWERLWHGHRFPNLEALAPTQRREPGPPPPG